jgi:hypothetical protein
MLQGNFAGIAFWEKKGLRWIGVFVRLLVGRSGLDCLSTH